MKNFKKVLALVLAVVIVLGVAAISSAADFTDAEQITRREAVEVLNLLKVLEGFEDGSFKPTGDVTRGQMAKIICTIQNSGVDVGEQYKGACKFTDAAGNWAAGYIAYCNQEGIIAGKSATIFKPNDTVTGIEAAKMLLCAIGYKAEYCGLTGSAWANNTLSYARKAELLTDMDTVDLSKPLNREDTAQMVLNALQATMVEFTGGSSVTVGGVSIQNGATQTNVENKSESTLRNIKLDGLMQYGEKFFDGINLSAGNTDNFGRVGNVWSYKSEEVGPYAAVPTLKYENAVTGGTLYTALGKPKFGTNGISSVALYVDGKYQSAFDAANVIKAGSETEVASRGSKSEVYLSKDGSTLTIVVINYYVAQIASFKAEEKDAAGDIIKEAIVTIRDVDDVVATKKAAQDITGTNLYADGTAMPAKAIAAGAFTRSDALNHTVVWFTKGADANGNPILMEIGAAETATALVNSVSYDNGQYTLILASGNVIVSPKCAVNVTTGMIGQDVPYYLDPLGNVIYTTAIATTDFAYIYAIAYGSDALGGEDRSAVRAQLLLSDGTLKVVSLDKKTVENIKLGAGLQAEVNLQQYKGKTFGYLVNSDGTYYLELGNETTREKGHTVAPTDGVSITAGSPYMQTIEGTAKNQIPGVVLNANTVFVVETTDASTGNFVYSAYTGISAVPSVVAEKISYVLDGETSNAAVVFALNAENADIDASTIGMLYKHNGVDSNVAIVGVGGQTISYYTVKAVIDGQITTAKVTTSLYASLSNGANLFNQATLDADGCYASAGLNQAAYSNKLTKDFVDFTKDAEGNLIGNYTSGVIALKDALGNAETYAVDSSLPLYVYNQTTHTLVQEDITAFYSTDVNGIKVLFDGNKILVNDAFIPTALYVTVAK